MNRFLLAVHFLTIIPTGGAGVVPDDKVSGSSAYFPLVGAMQGGLALAVYSVTAFSPEVASALVLTVLAIISGGFHLDGLSDTFDALAVKSTGDREADIGKRLAVMKDGRAGAIGVAAVVLGILLKYSLMLALIKSAPMAVAGGVIFIMPVLSRWAMLPPMFHGSPARQDGLGRLFIGRVVAYALISSTALALLISLLAVGSSSGISFIFAVVAFIYASGYMGAGFFGRKFGGLTGDCLGAMSEIAEIIILGGALAWSRLFF